MARILHIAQMQEGQEAELRGYIAQNWEGVDFAGAGSSASASSSSEALCETGRP